MDFDFRDAIRRGERTVLADLFALAQEADAEPTSDMLRLDLRRTLNLQLYVLLSESAGGDAISDDLAGFQAASMEDLLRHDAPPLSTLSLVKNWAKGAADGTAGSPSPQVARTVYFACIAKALQAHRQTL